MPAYKSPWPFNLINPKMARGAKSSPSKWESFSYPAGADDYGTKPFVGKSLAALKNMYEMDVGGTTGMASDSIFRGAGNYQIDPKQKRLEGPVREDQQPKDIPGYTISTDEIWEGDRDEASKIAFPKSPMRFDDEQMAAIKRGEIPKVTPKQNWAAMMKQLMKGTNNGGPSAMLKLASVRGMLDKYKNIHKYENAGLKGTEDYLAKLKKKGIKTDLSIAASLVDTWTGSNLRAAYTKPMSKREKDLMIAQLEDRLGVYKDKRNQRREDIALKELEFEYKIRQKENDRKIQLYSFKAKQGGSRMKNLLDAAKLLNYKSTFEKRQADTSKVKGEEEANLAKQAKEAWAAGGEAQKMSARLEESIASSATMKDVVKLDKAIAGFTKGKPNSLSKLYAEVASRVRANPGVSPDEVLNDLKDDMIYKHDILEQQTKDK